MSDSERLDIRLVVEGIELEVTSITATAGIGRKATASIKIPASDTIHSWLPRTLVHTYVLSDTPDARSPYGNNSVHGSNWILLFTGEVAGYQYVKIEGSRYCVLQCVDLSNYWSAMRLYWGKASVSTKSYKQAIMLGSATMTKGKRVVDSTDDLIRILRAAPSTIPTLTGLLGGVVSLLESVGGVFYETKSKKKLAKFRGANDFFSQAELRLHLSRLIGVPPEDNTSSKFIDDKAFRRYFRRVARSVKSTASMEQLISTLLSKVYHNHSSVLAPMYRAEGETASASILVPAGTTITSAKAAKLDAVLDKLERTKKVVDDRRREGQLQNGSHDRLLRKDDNPFVPGSSKKVPLDTAGHVEFNSKLRAIGFGRAQGDRAVGSSEYEQLQYEIDADPEFDNKLKREVELGLLQAGLAQGQAEDITTGGDPAVDALSGVIPSSTPKDQEFFSHTEPKLRVLSATLKEAIGSISKGVRRTKYVKKTIEVKLQDRLITNIMRPDIYMVPPPVCNVLFPEQYTSVQFSRNWMSEVTRLWLHGKTSRGRALKKMYFAPHGDMISGPTTKDAMSAARHGKSFLMDHELFSGIIPSIEGIGDMETFAKINKQTERKEGTSPWGATRHMQRAAHYLFFKNRYANRRMSVEGPLNLNIVAGLPGLVLDPVLSDNRVGGEKGMHFVGMIETVSHTISQDGAKTSTTWSHCRPYNEAIELGDEAQVKRRKLIRRKVGTPDKGYWAMENLGTDAEGTPLPGSGGKVTTSGDVLREALIVQVGSLATVEEKWPELLNPNIRLRAVVITSRRRDIGTGGPETGGSRKKQDDERLLQNSGVDTPMSDAPYNDIRLHGPTVEEASSPQQLYSQKSTDADGKTTFVTDTNYVALVPYEDWMSVGIVDGVQVEVWAAGPEGAFKKIDRERQRYTTDIKFDKVAFEDGARPPWFSSVYLNNYIGSKVYQELIGCNSIVDAFNILEGETEVEGVHYVTVPTAGGGTTTEYTFPRDIISTSTMLESTDTLVALYTDLVKSGSNNVREFVKNYTARGYATMDDMFGKHSTQFQPLVRHTPISGPVSVDESKQDKGFHSVAFGDLTNLEKLEHEPLTQVGGSGAKRKIDPRVDPRAARYRSVLEYRNRLAAARGIRG